MTQINKGELIELAKKAGFGYFNPNGENSITDNCKFDITEMLAKFADLVSANAITSMQTEQPVLGVVKFAEEIQEACMNGASQSDLVQTLENFFDRTVKPVSEILEARPGFKYVKITDELAALPAGTKLCTHPAPSVTSMQGDSEPALYQYKNEDGEWEDTTKNYYEHYSEHHQVRQLFTHADRVKGVSDSTALSSLIKVAQEMFTELHNAKACLGLMVDFGKRISEAESQLSTNTDGWISVPPEPTEAMREVLRAIATHACHVDSAYKSVLSIAISQDKGE